MIESEKKQELEVTISLLEMEIGTLTGIRRSPNPLHSVVAGKLQLKREAEIKRLREELAEAA